ncbi:23935_t:CDS:2, partial [Racocetra persica]
ICGNVSDYNACGNSRPPGSLIDKINFIDGGGFITLDKRFYVYNLLQQEKMFKSLNLLDFSLYLKLISYHSLNLDSTYQLSNNINLTKLLSPFKIDLYLVRLKDNYDILLQYSVQINCSTDCVFNKHEIVMCRKFLKDEQKTCEISNNTVGKTFGHYDSGYPVFILDGNQIMDKIPKVKDEDGDEDV